MQRLQRAAAVPGVRGPKGGFFSQVCPTESRPVSGSFARSKNIMKSYLCHEKTEKIGVHTSHISCIGSFCSNQEKLCFLLTSWRVDPRPIKNECSRRCSRMFLVFSWAMAITLRWQLPSVAHLWWTSTATRRSFSMFSAA